VGCGDGISLDMVCGKSLTGHGKSLSGQDKLSLDTLKVVKYKPNVHVHCKHLHKHITYTLIIVNRLPGHDKHLLQDMVKLYVNIVNCSLDMDCVS
jgi:hypothetical protein